MTGASVPSRTLRRSPREASRRRRRKPPLFHIGWAHEREVVLEHSIATHKQVLN